MTDRSDAPLGSCQFCGAKRIMAGQSHCVACGGKLLQPSEVALGPVPAVAAPPAEPGAPLAPAEPAIPVVTVPTPGASSIPEHSPASAQALAPAFLPVPPLPASDAAPTAAPSWAATAPGDAAATPPPAAYFPPPPAAYFPPPPAAYSPPPPPPAGLCPRCGAPWFSGAACCIDCGFAAQGPAGVQEVVAAPVEVAAAGGRRSSVSRRFVAIGLVLALVAMVAVGSVSAYVLLSGPNPTQITHDLITKMAARDATASTYLESGDSLRTLAAMMGIVNVPGSTSLSLDNLQVTVPNPSPSASRISKGDWPVTASYTLKWSGKGSSGKVDQKLTAVVRQGTDGKTRLVQINVSPALTFDLATCFGTTGTSEADATKVADDLRAGNKWIPGVDVKVVARPAPLTVPDVLTPVPGHLTTWSQPVSPEVSGTTTTWSVQVTSGQVTYADISPATAVTSQPVAAKVNIGNITLSDASSQAKAASTAFWAAVDAGDVAKANSMVLAGPKLSASGLARMKGWDTGLDNAGVVSEGPNGPEDELDTDTYVLGSNGTTWAIDSSRSHLVLTVLNGNGHYSLTGQHRENGVVTCSTNIEVSLSRVEFYTDDSAPEAVFSFSSSNNCDVYDTIITATVGWSGNSGVDLEPDVSGTEAGTTVERVVDLPTDLKSNIGPVWIKITGYGDPGGTTLPEVMTFSTN